MASKAPPSSSNTKNQNDPLSIQRGDYASSSLPATLLFTLGRALSGPLQYYIITHHPLQALFTSLPPVPTGGVPITLSLPVSMAGLLGLNPTQTFARFPFMCATMMPGLAVIKQLIWLHLLMRERMTLPFAFFAVTADMLYEVVSSLVFTTAAANPLWSEGVFNFGFTLFAASVAVELVSELQRWRFKRDPANKGKICKSGLWGLVRHVNYGCNMVYGWAYGLACGGWAYGGC